MTKFSSVLASLALVASAIPAMAQQDDIIQIDSAPYLGKLDLATGVFSPSSIDPDSLIDSNPSIIYDNSTTNGYLTTGGGNIVANHHMDWGTLTTTFGQGAMIEELRLSIATNLAAPSAPPGLRLRIYQGATGFGVQGTVIADYTINPGLLSSVAGQYQGGTFDVTLPTALNIADGPIGWSFNVDNPVGAPTSATGILLAGPPNGPGAGAAHGQTFGSYDRYNEATNAYVNTFAGAGPVAMTSFTIRMRGRENGAPPSAWTNYGIKNKVTLTGDGSATPGSVDNVITVKANPAGKDFILVAGITQSDFFLGGPGLHFYAFPWLVQLAPITTPLLNGTVNLPAAFPANVPVGLNIYLQAFAQNLGGNYVNWSEGLQVTIQ
jgi:hypothetical protein